MRTRPRACSNFFTRGLFLVLLCFQTVQAKEVDEFSYRLEQIERLENMNDVVDRLLNERLQAIEQDLNELDPKEELRLENGDIQSSIKTHLQGLLVGQMFNPVEWWINEHTNEISIFFLAPGDRGIYGGALSYNDFIGMVCLYRTRHQIKRRADWYR